ncbi:Z1 domain-containing protein [uncultured Methanocorpusculum sp.]|nr:Z1 domain-containing protein [uncultured Methanocorpusculum sp.]
MIDISELDYSQRLLYISAYEECKKEISTRDLKQSKAIEEIVAKYKPLIHDTDHLSQYLEGEINCSIEYGNTVGIYGKNVRNSHWWSDYKVQNNKLNYWSRYSKYLIEKKNWDPVVVENSIDVSTDTVMNVLANPIISRNQPLSDFPVQAFTSRDENGDFNNKKLTISLNPPLIIVTKKNKTVLEALNNYWEKCTQYFGAKEFFGLKNDENEDMPLYREIVSDNSTQTEQNLESGLNNKESIGPMLESAIQMFFLSTAARNCRGQRNHPNSMLIHTDRLKSEHSLWENDINNYLEALQIQIIFNDEDTLQNLKTLWTDDYLPTSKKMHELYRNRVGKLPVETWENIEKELRSLSRDGPDKIRLKKINGDSEDFLTYKEHIDKNLPYNVIALGGDKLSRGLTLEGLTVSYFSRPSKNYDTLMQMGRWFGYRPGYLDLCRLFVPSSLYDNFRHISIATENLLQQIDYMNDLDATPEEFGLRVATHPDMLISNRNKLRTGRDFELSFSNTFSQTT